MDFESLCVQEGEDTEFNAPHIQAVYLSSSYKFSSLDQGIKVFDQSDEGDVYSRYGHPNHRSLAIKLSQLETAGSDLNAAALITNSGMSAIYTLLSSLCQSGDVILSANDLYGGSSDLMKHNLKLAGIKTIFTDLSDTGYIEELIKKERPKVIYLESPSNPLLRCYDIEKIATLVKGSEIKLVVDNTFCTPYIQQPLLLGADYTIYSTTKYLNGHGNALGGAIIGKDIDFINTDLLKGMRLSGSTISPFDAWLLGQGLKTLTLRLEKQQKNAMDIAQFLEDHPKVKRTYYPGLKGHSSHDLATRQMKGFGAMISFELDSDPNEFIDKLQLITLAPTLGDVHSLVLHPSSMSHRNMDPSEREAMGINNQLIRLSVGIESSSDLIKDLQNGLEG